MEIEPVHKTKRIRKENNRACDELSIKSKTRSASKSSGKLAALSDKTNSFSPLAAKEATMPPVTRKAKHLCTSENQTPKRTFVGKSLEEKRVTRGTQLKKKFSPETPVGKTLNCGGKENKSQLVVTTDVFFGQRNRRDLLSNKVDVVKKQSILSPSNVQHTPSKASQPFRKRKSVDIDDGHCKEPIYKNSRLSDVKEAPDVYDFPPCEGDDVPKKKKRAVKRKNTASKRAPTWKDLKKWLPPTVQEKPHTLSSLNRENVATAVSGISGSKTTKSHNNPISLKQTDTAAVPGVSGLKTLELQTDPILKEQGGTAASGVFLDLKCKESECKLPGSHVGSAAVPSTSDMKHMGKQVNPIPKTPIDIVAVPGTSGLKAKRVPKQPSFLIKGTKGSPQVDVAVPNSSLQSLSAGTVSFGCISNKATHELSFNEIPFSCGEIITSSPIFHQSPSAQSAVSHQKLSSNMSKPSSYSKPLLPVSSTPVKKPMPSNQLASQSMSASVTESLGLTPSNSVMSKTQMGKLPLSASMNTYRLNSPNQQIGTNFNVPSDFTHSPIPPSYTPACPPWNHEDDSDVSEMLDDIPRNSKFSLPARIFASRHGTSQPPLNKMVPECHQSQTSHRVAPSSSKGPHVRFTASDSRSFGETNENTLGDLSVDNCFGFEEENDSLQEKIMMMPTRAEGKRAPLISKSTPLRRKCVLSPKLPIEVVHALLMGQKEISSSISSGNKSINSPSHPVQTKLTDFMKTVLPSSPSAGTSSDKAAPMPVTSSPVPLFGEEMLDVLQSPYLKENRQSYDRTMTVKKVVCGDGVISDDEVGDLTGNFPTLLSVKEKKPKASYKRRNKKKDLKEALINQWASEISSHFEEVDNVQLALE